MAVARKQPSMGAEQLHDRRVDCYSIITTMPVESYLAMVAQAYQKRGGIDFQREKLRTTSAIRIRRRMVADIVQGAVLPPVVIGVVLPRITFASIGGLNTREVVSLVRKQEDDRVSIIDGMQRTTALGEALSSQGDVAKRKMRVEFWISESTNSLIYRMLVLNTGQVPWNLRSQVEVVFRSLILEVESAVTNLKVLKQDEGRRSKGGQFQANELVELFLVFGARKEKIDIRERLADEFTKLDFMEAASDRDFAKHFTVALDILVRMDVLFDRCKKLRGGDKDKEQRFAAGKDLFASQPACVGLITAIATEVFGRPGVSRLPTDQMKKIEKITKGLGRLEKKFHSATSDRVGEFLAFQTLNEAISRGKSGLSVGDMEREFFLKGFQVLLEEDFNVVDMAPCWRAY